MSLMIKVKYCPLMIMADKFTSDRTSIKCREEKCAWYDKNKTKCSINTEGSENIDR